MKAKYLLGMLFGSVVLASCSTEDDLNLSKPTQDVNPSAPVFNVYFDNNGELQTRATFNEEGWKVGFEGEDKLSLFHGMTTDLTGWQNAIYEGEGDENAIKFTTRSMVAPGLAVMVYPAMEEYADDDLGENGLGEGNPYITISPIQDEKTKLATPYMTNVLKITLSGKDGEEEDEKVVGKYGYGQEYDIVLRRVASTMSMKLNPSATDDIDAATAKAGVDPVEVTGVTLDAGNNNKLFPTKVKIIIPSSDSDLENDSHTSWVKKSDIEVVTDKNSQTITTKDVKDGTATFTLLPVTTNATTLSSAAITVITNYGTVTLNDANAKVIKNKAGDEFTVNAGVQGILSTTLLWGAAPTGNTFAGQSVGGHFNRTLDVDMSKLKMDGLHVGDIGELINALKVYKEYCPGTEVEFILDGKDEGKFVMTAAEYEEVQKLIGENKITLTPCQDETKCSAIQITGGNNNEIPNLVFGKKDSEIEEFNVELSGSWTYIKVTDDKTLKKFRNVTNIVLLDGTLTLNNDIAAEVDEDENYTLPKIVVEKDVTVNVAGNVGLKMDMDNYGEIVIPEGGDYRLRVGNEKTLTNMAASGEDDDAFSEGGVIKNHSYLGIIDSSNGQILNYGVIRILNANATTLVTANQTEEADITAPFSPENAFGSIYLYSATDKAIKVNDDERQGFIKFVYTAADITSDNIGSVANYIIAGQGCKGIGNTANKGVTTSNSKMKYLEVQGTDRFEVGSLVPASVDAIVLREGKALSILSGTTFKTTVIYVKGSLIRSGTFGYTNIAETYFGGIEKDKENIITFDGAPAEPDSSDTQDPEEEEEEEDESGQS